MSKSCRWCEHVSAGLRAHCPTHGFAPPPASDPAPRGEDQLHTGDDALLDALTEARVALEEVEDEGQSEEAIATALEALDQADQLRLTELRSRTPRSSPPGERPDQGLIQELRDRAQYYASRDTAEGRLFERAADALASRPTEAPGERPRDPLLPPNVSIVLAARGGVQIEGHTLTQDWEIEVDEGGNLIAMSQEPARPPALADRARPTEER